MYLRIRLEDGDATALSGEPDQEDLQGVDDGDFTLIKFENGNFLAAEISFNEPGESEEGFEPEDGAWEVTWTKVNRV